MPNPLRPKAFGGLGAEGMKKEIPAVIGYLEPLPKRFAEKIEAKFPVARRERGSAAGCVTEELRRHREFWPILIRATNAASKSSPQKITFFGKGFLQGVYAGGNGKAGGAGKHTAPPAPSDIPPRITAR